ncbi:MAG TPA: DUF484 family protein [Burkholderiales bacterium]|jgi:uncharacterized protein YigA (DUF484 family)|nr:DUF484 family protein [Burkholderiales bacterium]
MTALLDSKLVADYLLDHPHFFEEHAELLGRIRLTSPVLGRAISLQERQMEILREKIRIQDLHMADLLRIAHENDEIAQKFQSWTRALLATRNAGDLPRAMIDSLQTIFNVPQATLRLWQLNAAHSDAWYAGATSDDAHIFADGLSAPFCGPNNDFEAAQWLAEPGAVQSIAILPLRSGASPQAFGLLVLGSDDAQRFSADMATDFLSRIGETASAALTSLRD